MRLVYVIEADDDYPRGPRDELPWLVRRLHCYALLADGLILHPAYIWQSRTTHDALRVSDTEILQSQITKFPLGDADSIVDYLKERLSKLGKAERTTEEEHQYRRWGSNLLSLAQRIDSGIAPSQVHQLAHSRDTKFRQLLEADLRSSVDPASLRSQISTHIQSRYTHLDVDNICEDLIRFVRDAELVSMETFRQRVSVHSLWSLLELPDFGRRLLSVYASANVDETVLIPGLSAFGDSVVDPYDPDIFWAVFTALFGQDATDVFSSTPNAEVARSIREVRDTEQWQRFLKVYLSVLVQVDYSFRQSLSTVVRSIEGKLGKTSVSAFLKQLWKKHKVEVIGTVFGALALTFGTPLTTTFGLASLALGSRQIVATARRFMVAYHTSGYAKVRELVATRVAEVWDRIETSG